MRIVVIFGSVAAAIGLILLVIRIAETGRLNLGLAGIVIRDEQPICFWALVMGLVVIIVLLLLLGAVVIIGDRDPFL